MIEIKCAKTVIRLYSSASSWQREKPVMTTELTEAEISEIIQMALSDHDSFGQIKQLYGLPEKDVKALMRKSLKRGSYEAWRKRVRQFSDRRAHYK